ncbi:unnamed protein product [Caretta caretta]
MPELCVQQHKGAGEAGAWASQKISVGKSGQSTSILILPSSSTLRRVTLLAAKYLWQHEHEQIMNDGCKGVHSSFTSERLTFCWISQFSAEEP